MGFSDTVRPTPGVEVNVELARFIRNEVVAAVSSLAAPEQEQLLQVPPAYQPSAVPQLDANPSGEDEDTGEQVALLPTTGKGDSGSKPRRKWDNAIPAIFVITHFCILVGIPAIATSIPHADPLSLTGLATLILFIPAPVTLVIAALGVSVPS